MKIFTSNMQNILLDRTPLLFILIHWTLFFLAVFLRGGDIEIHFYYEPWLALIILILDLPSIIIAESLSMPLNQVIRENYPLKEVLIFVTTISTQWLIIGWMAKQLIRDRRRVD